jgi:hypothetical protein
MVSFAACGHVRPWPELDVAGGLVIDSAARLHFSPVIPRKNKHFDGVKTQTDATQSLPGLQRALLWEFRVCSDPKKRSFGVR